MRVRTKWVVVGGCGGVVTAVLLSAEGGRVVGGVLACGSHRQGRRGTAFSWKHTHKATAVCEGSGNTDGKRPGENTDGRGQWEHGKGQWVVTRLLGGLDRDPAGVGSLEEQPAHLGGGGKDMSKQDVDRAASSPCWWGGMPFWTVPRALPPLPNPHAHARTHASTRTHTHTHTYFTLASAATDEGREVCSTPCAWDTLVC